MANKRGADVQLTKDGRWEDTAMQDDTPTRATAAQIANRRIKAPKRRTFAAGTSGNSVPGNTATASFNINTATASPSFNFGPAQTQPQTNISTPFSFGSSSSFPPTNGVAATGNLTDSKSFGGFGSGGNGGFNFGGGSSTQATGTSSGNSGVPFSFGAPTNNSFGFGSSGAAPQSASNPFAQPSNPTPQSTPFSFGSNNTINGNNNNQQSQPPPSPFSNPFSSIPTKPIEPESKPASSPFGFGSTPTSSFPALQPAAISQPSASPSPTPEPQQTSEESIDESPKVNPFATLTIPPRSPPKSASEFKSNTPAQTQTPLFSATTGSTQASTNIFGSGKPTLAPPSAQSTPASPGNIFANSAASFSGLNQTTSSQSPSKPTVGFGASPAKPLFASSTNSTPAASTPFTNMFGTGSTPSISTGASASPATPTTNVFSAFKPSVPPPSASQAAAAVTPSFLGNASPAKSSQTQLSNSPTVSQEALREQLSEGWIKTDSLPRDPKERAYAIRDLKVYRLNQNMSSLMDNWSRTLQSTPANRFVDLRQVWVNYGQFYEAIENELQQKIGNTIPASTSNPGPILFGSSAINSTSTPPFSQAAGFGAFGTTPSAQNQGPTAASTFVSTKRKADIDENDEERAKKSKPSPATPQSAQKSNTASKFENFLNSSTTPSNSTQNLFNGVPATPPQNKVNAGSTPFKPATAFKPTTTSTDVPKAPASAPFKLFSAAAPANANGSAVPKPSFANPINGGFKPSGIAAPTASGFKPTGVFSGGGFVSQFGKSAEKTAAQLKRKAKMEEFDSDEDDEAEWERQYDERQKKKQKEFEEARAKLGSGPKFVPQASAVPKFSFLGDSDSNRSVNGDGATLSRSVSPAGSVLDGPKPLGGHMFSHLSPAPSESGKDDDDEDDDEDGQANGSTTPKASGSGLFNRMGKDGHNLPDDNPGDHTWKENTPIKFRGASTTSTPGIFKFPTPGAAANPTLTPAFGGLFGSKTPTVTVSSPSALNTPVPTAGFTFGSKSSALAPPSGSSSVLNSTNSSRAPTPQLSEMSDSALDTSNETDDEENKSSDLVNFEGATKGHQLLFKVEKAKALVHHPELTKDRQWVTQGVGPIAILKNDESGATSIFMKAAPSGRIVLNTRLISGAKYEQMAKRARFPVQGADGKMVSNLVQFTKMEDAKLFAEVCEANKKK